MICSICGQWNDEQETRCSRCGRRLNEISEGSWKRSGLEFNNTELKKPRKPQSGTPPPVWKHEVSRKLEQYRERQRNSGARADSNERGEGSGDSNDSNVIPFQRTAPPEQDRVPVAPLPRLGEPSSERRLPEAGKAEMQRPLLPSLGGKSSLIRSEPIPAKPAMPPPRPSLKEVRCRATVAPSRMRILAAVLDVAVVVIALGAFLAVFHWFGGTLPPDRKGFSAIAITAFTLLCFYWAFYVGHFGDTPGMSWLNLQLLDFYGRKPSGKQQAARALGLILSSGTLGIGFLWSFLDEEKLTWHDRMSKTFLTHERTAAAFRSKPPVVTSRHLPDLPSRRKG